MTSDKACVSVVKVTGVCAVTAAPLGTTDTPTAEVSEARHDGNINCDFNI